MATLCQLLSIHHPASYGFASGLTTQSAVLVSGLYTVLVRFFTLTETCEVTWVLLFIVNVFVCACVCGWGGFWLWVFVHTGRASANSQVVHNDNIFCIPNIIQYNIMQHLHTTYRQFDEQ